MRLVSRHNHKFLFTFYYELKRLNSNIHYLGGLWSVNTYKNGRTFYIHSRWVKMEENLNPPRVGYSSIVLIGK